jgi:hypothetical protein
VALHVVLEYLAEITGFGAAVALTIQPWGIVRDLRQAREHRVRAEDLTARGELDEAKEASLLAEGLEQAVGRWDLKDSRLVKYGGIALAVSFALKMAALHFAPAH